jgi:hypothetical protein
VTAITLLCVLTTCVAGMVMYVLIADEVGMVLTWGPACSAAREGGVRPPAALHYPGPRPYIKIVTWIAGVQHCPQRSAGIPIAVGAQQGKGDSPGAAW